MNFATKIKKNSLLIIKERQKHLRKIKYIFKYLVLQLTKQKPNSHTNI